MQASGDNEKMNQDKPETHQAPPSQATERKESDAVPVAPTPQDPRRRLRELLAIPERDRSDPVWDEIISLEIQLAPGNRAPGAPGDGRRQDQGRRPEQGRRPDGGRRPQDGPSGGKPSRRFNKKPSRGPGQTNNK